MEETAGRAKAPRRVRRRAPGCVSAGFNLLSTVLLALTGLVTTIIVVLFVWPGILGWFGGDWLLFDPQPTQAVLLGMPTAPGQVPDGTAVAGFPTLPPEWTATHTPTVTPTRLPATDTPQPTTTPLPRTRTPTATRTPTRTATPQGPTPTPTRTRAPFNYTLQNNEPTYLTNYINTSGCNWFGIAGQVFALDGRAQIGLTIHLEGGGLSLDALSGSEPAIGPGGYQIPISNRPIETTDTYRVQLRNNTGTPLSDTYVIRTYGDCDRNLVLVNFVQNH